ncbi:uncharacterized protein CANTADRAFT_20699 [Suhomyces tanzawaensis NRRL Y-17324]|uniref:Uncharacterized protein n=1 Tax=Suhomyces tanzawaensis NRRL Y-17324 TaxID=984487 RepID=A0A1E4SNR4_9ASCO|nr:uncharacterized protein CANTADRAFT_20699 [Suhomyces tanzawaensis NRRL Y-17324]ODV81161.1 hypothetical protein CANTADRAFT_20699 [Suhomyces tanzawaensis NRRL Y-17324]
MSKRGIGGGVLSGTSAGTAVGTTSIHLGDPLPLPYKIASVDDDDTAVDTIARKTNRIGLGSLDDKPKSDIEYRPGPRRTLELRKPLVEDPVSVSHRRHISGDVGLEPRDEYGREHIIVRKGIRRPPSESKPQFKLDPYESVPKNVFPRKKYDIVEKVDHTETVPRRIPSVRRFGFDQGVNNGEIQSNYLPSASTHPGHEDTTQELDDPHDITISQIDETAQELISSIDNDLNKLHLLIVNNQDTIDDVKALESIKTQVEKTIGATVSNLSRDRHETSTKVPTILEELDRLQKLDRKNTKYSIQLDYRYAIVFVAVLVFLVSSFVVSGLNYEYCYYFC